MKFKSKLFIMFVLGISIIPCLLEAQKNQDVLTLERIFKNNDFELNQFGPAVWLKDGSGYTTLEESNKYPMAKDIIKYNPKSGKRSILVNASQLIPKDAQNPLLISDYTWSADGKKLLVFTNTERVWRYETRGDYWVLNIVSGELSQLGKFAKPSTLMFAKF